MSETAKDLLRKYYLDPVDIVNTKSPQYHGDELDPYRSLVENEAKAILDEPDLLKMTYPIQEKKEPAYSWETEYKSVSKLDRPIPKPSRIRLSPKFNSSYDINTILSTYRELQSKQIGDIYLTGSVALYLQGKISRTNFKDLDIIVLGDYELDDDIQDYNRGFEYPQVATLGENKCIVFNNMPIDLFKFDKNELFNLVEIDVDGFTYVCQDYKDIIKAKFNMIISKMKDSSELYGACFDLKFN